MSTRAAGERQAWSKAISSALVALHSNTGTYKQTTDKKRSGQIPLSSLKSPKGCLTGIDKQAKRIIWEQKAAQRITTAFFGVSTPAPEMVQISGAHEGPQKGWPSTSPVGIQCRDSLSLGKVYHPWGNQASPGLVRFRSGLAYVSSEPSGGWGYRHLMPPGEAPWLMKNAIHIQMIKWTPLLHHTPKSTQNK